MPYFPFMTKKQKRKKTLLKNTVEDLWSPQHFNMLHMQYTIAIFL